MIRFILFDLDETLYPTSNGLMQAIGNRMRTFIMQRYGLPADEAHALQKRYWQEYGTTLRGLYVERQMDPQEYLKFVHDLPLREFVVPDPRLRKVLERIPQEKVIVTNADAPHARRVLDVLGVSDLFTRIFDVVCFEYECKPAAAVYRRVLELLPARGEECVMVEDTERNIIPARALGIRSILVGRAGIADAQIETIYEVADTIAGLERDEGQTGGQ